MVYLIPVQSEKWSNKSVVCLQIAFQKGGVNDLNQIVLPRIHLSRAPSLLAHDHLPDLGEVLDQCQKRLLQISITQLAGRGLGGRLRSAWFEHQLWKKLDHVVGIRSQFEKFAHRLAELLFFEQVVCVQGLDLVSVFGLLVLRLVRNVSQLESQLKLLVLENTPNLLDQGDSMQTPYLAC